MRTKVFLFALALVSASTNLKAQDSDTKFAFGLKVAPTIAWLKSETKSIESDGSRLGFAYGLMADYHFSKNYALATGIEVSYRGGKTKAEEEITPGTINSYKQSLTLQYIELPIAMKLKTNEIGYITYFGKFGFAPGINIKAKADNEVNGEKEDDVSIKSDINAFNLSFLAGLGAQYSLGGKTAVLMGITFNNGFLDIDDTEGYKATSSFLALDLGIMF